MSDKSRSSLEDLWDIEDRFSALAGSAIGVVRAAAQRSLPSETISKEEETELQNAYNQIEAVEQGYRKGLITNAERYNQIVYIWTLAGDEISAGRAVREGAAKSISNYHKTVLAQLKTKQQRCRQLAPRRTLLREAGK